MKMEPFVLLACFTPVLRLSSNLWPLSMMSSYYLKRHGSPRPSVECWFRHLSAGFSRTS